MLDPVKNFSKATLTAGIASGDLSLTVSTGEGAEFPAPATDGTFNLVLWNSTDYGDPADDPLVEIVRCTARSTDTFTITRAQEGTSDNNHNIADKIYKIALPFTKKEHDEIAIQYNTISVSGNYTAALFGNILVDTTAGNITISLPSGSGIAGRIYTIKKTDGSNNDVIIDPSGSETIDGETTIDLNRQYMAVRIVTNGSNWFLI